MSTATAWQVIGGRMLESNTTIESQLSGLYPLPGKTGLDWYIFCSFVNEFGGNNLEIGVGHGGSALSMYAYSKKLTLVDAWKQNWHKENCQYFLQNAHFFDCDSKDFKSKEKFDVIHLDANKDYEGTINDLSLSESLDPKIIVVDDFLQSFWPNVTKATFDFVKNSKYKIIFIGNFQAILAKDTSSSTYREIIINFPVAITDDLAHFSYGDLPRYEILDKMIKKSHLNYPWHTTEEKIVKNV